MARDSTTSHAAARRSNINRPHVPFVGDNPERGKRTGFTSSYQAPDDPDDFEDFAGMMARADDAAVMARSNKTARTPVKKGRLSQQVDNEGEQSMEMASPVANHYYEKRTTPAARVKTANERAKAGSEPFPRSTNDTIPIPPRAKALPRASLSKARQEPDYEPDFGADDDIADYDDNTPTTPRHNRGKFSRMDDEDEDEDRVGDVLVDTPQSTKSPSPIRKSKKAPLPAPSNGVESEEEDQVYYDDQDLQPIDEEEDIEEEEEEVVEEQPPPKRRKAEKGPVKVKPQKPKTAKTAKQAAKKQQDEPRPLREAIQGNNSDDDDEEGPRRSKRHKMEPLDWWRGEHVIVRRSDKQHTYTANPVEIVRVPKDEAKSFATKRKRGRSKTPGVSKEVKTNPEAGWDDSTKAEWLVKDAETRELHELKIAHTLKMCNPQPAGGKEKWLYEKIFSDAEFIASGIVELPLGSRKPGKGTKDNTYMFYVVQGAVNVVLNDNRVDNIVLSTGAMFMVPRGNLYSLENIAARTSKLFFVQARKLIQEEDDEDDNEAAGRSSARPTSQAPGSAAGTPAAAARRPVSKVPRVNGRPAAASRN